MTIKEKGDGTPYARKEEYEYEGQSYEADIKSGDKVKILNGGTVEEGNFGEQTYFKIDTRNGERKAPFNQSSINVLVKAWGDESSEWEGKTASVLTKKGIFAGKKGIATYFVVDGWSLDEYGDLVNESQDNETEYNESTF